MDVVAAMKGWFNQNQAQIKKDYFAFLRFASISADPAKKKDCVECAGWLCAYFEKRGICAELVATPGLPLVFAEVDSKAKETLLIYGHYDVQPVEPLDQWLSPPFEPEEREGSVFARGAVDDKGQIFYAVVALICLKELGFPIPCNVKFCIEGEEESASKGLFQALGNFREKLRSDHLLVVDFDQFDRDIPAICLGARGIVALEVTIRGSKVDMHSGHCGGIAYNPNRALVQLLSKLWDDRGRVQVPQFYDGIVDPSEEEKGLYSTRFDSSYYERQFGIRAFGGEAGYSLQEANWFRPTLEINGMEGGHTGVGIKTVIPATAHAKITCRLVPNQNPAEISKQIASFLRRHLLQGLEMEIVEHQGTYAFRTPCDLKLAKIVAEAAKEVTRERCRYTLSGGSIPVIPALMEALGIAAVGMGYGLLEDEIHAPNEHFDMHRFEQGFLTIGRIVSLVC